MKSDNRILILVVWTASYVFVAKSEETLWPSGTYGLPQPLSGCPDDTKTYFRAGWTYHDTEDDNPENQRSNIYHLAGNFSQHGIQQNFCIKDNPDGGSEFWPDGNYCLYKKGKCPTNMVEGFIRWDDEQSLIDLNDKHEGDLPDGIYEKTHTTIRYCCMSGGNVNTPIELPALKPFYLMSFKSSQCQKVAGMRVTSEFVKFDDDDQGNTDAADGAHPYGPSEDPFNLKIYYCYYEPGQQSTDDIGTGKDVLGKASKAPSNSGLAVAIGCGVAGAIVGTASIAFATKRILAHRARANFEELPQPDAS